MTMNITTLQDRLNERAQAEAERRAKVAIDALYNGGYRWIETIHIDGHAFDYYHVSEAIKRSLVPVLHRIILAEMTEDLLTAVEKINEIAGKVEGD